MRVLLCGPLPATTTSLSGALRAAGATVLRCVPDEAVASARIDEADLVLLDPTAAGGESWRAVTALRRAGLDVGIVLLADADPTDDIIEAWLEQADDCLLGRPSAREIVAHARAIDRRRRGRVGAGLDVRGVSIDVLTGEVRVNGRVLRIPPKPRSMLEVLLAHAGTVISKERLFTAVYGCANDCPDMKIVDTYLCRLRKNLMRAGAERDLIETVHGEGYLLRRTPALRVPISFWRGPIDAPVMTAAKRVAA